MRRIGFGMSCESVGQLNTEFSSIRDGAAQPVTSLDARGNDFLNTTWGRTLGTASVLCSGRVGVEISGFQVRR